MIKGGKLMKLWGGHFRSEENTLMEESNKSFGFDHFYTRKILREV